MGGQSIDAVAVTNQSNGLSSNRYVMDRDLNKIPPVIVKSQGNYLTLESGQKIFDACSGAAVSCVGHGNKEVSQALLNQAQINLYSNSMDFTTASSGKLAAKVIEGTGFKLAKAYFASSGSEATEVAIKLAHQYFEEIGQPERTRFIARETSYHGNTIGALAISGHIARRNGHDCLLPDFTSWIPACNPYRQRLSPSELDTDFVVRKASELDAEFVRVGSNTVVAFVCEPISGAALGCVPYVPGYLAAMKAVCVKHGALFILDEIMCGMGRSGTLHSWQAEHSDAHPFLDCVPDIQMIGKGLGGGYVPLSAVLVGHKVIAALQNGTGSLKHGQTFQAHPLACAGALAVQTIIERESLCENARIQGEYLSSLLHKELDAHPYVGNIRGKGLFWGIEFVANKEKKRPFDIDLNVAGIVKQTAMQEPWSIGIYCGQGTVDGRAGDHVMLAPALNITREDVEIIVGKLTGVVNEVFENLAAEGKLAGGEED